MARRVLFITDDMQRWDTIGAWNGPHAQYAQTPVIDSIARDGIQYWRGYNQNPEGELYHTAEDPRQRTDLWNDPAQKDRIEKMSALIYDELLNRPLLHPVGEPGALI